MSTIAKTAVFSTSIGKKLVMALTGIFLITFLIVHLSGNLLLLKGDNGEAFNAYARFMETSPLIRILELILAVGFLFHIVMGIRLALENRRARPIRYQVNKATENSTFYSRFMVWSGITVLFFLLLHLWNFFFQHRFLGLGAKETMYETVVRTFKEPIYSIVYIIAMVFLAFHLNHGFQSALQSSGLQINTNLGKRIKSIGMLFSIVICAGFTAIPLYFLIFT
ncbi:MAG: succinate dehydrogenase cytochrome b subunit [Bacteroidia bacterium]|nr:succinate dehydrogenase cytochrome b subunit [Bacteroidia bacterium]MDW8158919.1 succinate dehydrogenase cytochrome b subunit [Bacteroidia bacterium]